MKQLFVLLLCGSLMISSCDGSLASQGAGTGAYFGAIIGSAIGGISDGPRGSDIGTLIGMAGGAVVGAAIGSAADRAEQQKYREYQEQRTVPYSRDYQRYNNRQYSNDESDFDPTNSGDDRIEFEHGSKSGQPYSTVEPKSYKPDEVSLDQLKQMMPGYNVNYNEDVVMRNATFVDRDGNGILNAGEEAKVTFEIMNRSSAVIYDVLPMVVETSGNKHVHISPSILVESIMPGKGVKYTATIRGDKKLKDGQAVIRVAVRQGKNDITSQIKEFSVVTRRK